MTECNVSSFCLGTKFFWGWCMIVVHWIFIKAKGVIHRVVTMFIQSIKPLTLCLFFHHTVVLWLAVRWRHFHWGRALLCHLLTICAVGGTSKRKRESTRVRDEETVKIQPKIFCIWTVTTFNFVAALIVFKQKWGELQYRTVQWVSVRTRTLTLKQHHHYKHWYSLIIGLPAK